MAGWNIFTIGRIAAAFGLTESNMTNPLQEPIVFRRYEGASDDSDSGVRMPRRTLDARVSACCVAELLGRYERFTKGGSDGADMFPWASRFIMGFPLPEWQRPLVWSREQQVRFIESLWAGVDVGSYMVNETYDFMKTDGKEHYTPFSEILLDGQQRLASIEAYVLNEFGVPDIDGAPRFWSDLPRVERRRFGSIQFARANIKSNDEDELRLAYDLRSFGGTAHTEDQRAVSKRTPS